MIDYWRSRSFSGRAPERAAINPAEFSKLIPQVFIWGRAASGLYPVRLAGGFVADLHGRDLRLENGLSLWSERDRSRLRLALEEARRRPQPIVVTAEVLTDGPSLPMEVLFAPLGGGQRGPDRFLGIYQPLALTARLMGREARELAIRTIRTTGPANEEAPRLRLATLDGRRIA